MSEWTADQVRDLLQRQIDDLRTRLNERFEAQQRAVDAAFVTAERAVDRQAASLEKEFHEHLVQYRHEVALAFEASDKAIQKAEMATEKRFENVNEFRGQLSDQVTTFIPRAEASQGFDTLLARVQADSQRLEQLVVTSNDRSNDRVTELTKRLDMMEGKAKGLSAAWGLAIGVVGLFLAILGVVSFFNGSS